MIRRTHRRRGQTMVEYMLVISILVITIIFITYGPMNAAMTSGSKSFRDNVASSAEAGAIGTNVGNSDPR